MYNLLCLRLLQRRQMNKGIYNISSYCTVLEHKWLEGYFFIFKAFVTSLRYLQQTLHYTRYRQSEAPFLGCLLVFV
jgi:hypothetical protein